MLAHSTLRFKTAELQQEEVVEDLPKAIRSSIAQHLFHTTIQNTYLFKGVSEDFLVQLVMFSYLPTTLYACCFHPFNLNYHVLCSTELNYVLAHFTLQVSEIKAEYFPPKVDIVIQNEILTDFYIIVSGAVVCVIPACQ